MPNLFFSRYHITTSKDISDKIDFLLTGLRNDARIDVKEFVYKFFDSEIVSFEGADFITGNLVKYHPEDKEKVVDEITMQIRDAEVKNKVVGMMRYIIDPSSSIIMFAEVPNVISKEAFSKIFPPLFEQNHDFFNTQISLSPIKEQYSFIEEVRSFKAIKKIIIVLYPSNPNFADRWKSIDERLRNNNINKYREVQTNNIPGQNISVDTETENKFLMAEDGYGVSRASGIDATGEERTVSTKDEKKHINKPITVDLNKVTDVLLLVSETLQDIVQRTK